ncbi:uncharacterized protein UTRI_00832 [Ustilago trichophora]|uniref:DH domain-containing protein n=1 Tax=Ustilago trichophora TaxID=86804 RepID=A0A5C3DSR8_9BASI|nr:uncharacterized protein UTRI_00832 [Ustilago trichophora]
MSASQLTPRANPIPLLPEKSLPPPPPSSPPSDNNQGGPSTSTSYSANTVKALPARPAFQRSWTEHRPTTADSDAEPGMLAHPPRSKSSGNTASFLELDPESPQNQSFAGSATSQSEQDQYAEPARSASSNIESSPPQAFYSPCLNMPDSPRTTRRSVQLSSLSSGVITSSDRRAPRPSLPAQWKSNADLTNGNASATPPRMSSVEAAKLPEPSTFSGLAGSQHDHSGQSSPASQRLSSNHAHFSSDYSVRNSASTHASIWTERSLASCGTSPACTQHGLKSEEGADGADNKKEDAVETTEELDESSVGLGITSDLEHDTSSRRSSAAPVLPSLPGSAQALQGPFSHHRAPSWTRRMDISPFAGLPSHPYEFGEGFAAPLEGSLRTLGLNVGFQMQRALSDVTPMSSASGDIAAAVASASSSSTLASPSIPLRRDSRIRCSSDSANYHPTAPNAAKHSHSPSLSISSSSASNSGRFAPGLPAASSSYLGGSDLSALQSPPRSSSLRQSPSISSLRSSPSVVKDGSQRTPPAIAPLLVGRRPSRPTLDRIMTINDLSNSISAVQQAPESESGRESPSVSLRTSSALSRARRVSDASINSFLQNGEFSHIVGAYTSRMRWEEGLYDFDESAETDGDESRAVKTAEEGSAAIVQGRNLTVAQIEAETGPNTTHLLLSGNKVDGLLEVLERVLPLTTNLLVLDLSNCGLQHLPDAIGSCIALEELDISGNPVDHLPDWILNLRALRTLSADRIGLHHLPSSLIQLQELQRLSLRNNQLVFLPSWLHRMSKLTNLFVEGNNFRGPWQDIVAPLLAQADQPLAAPFQPTQQQHFDEAHATHSGLRSATHANFGQVSPRPPMPRMRSANDLQTMLNAQFGSQTPPVSTPDFQSDDSGYVSPIDIHSRPTTGYEDRVTRLSYAADEADPHATGGGKWGGFLKKIGRKASSHRLASAYHETISPSESRFSSPKASRKSIRSSGGAARSNSISKSDGMTPFMTPSQSEPISPSVVITSQSLAAAIGESRANYHAPMTPLEPPSEPVTPLEPTMLLQPIALDAEAKKARRRSFLPVHAFAAATQRPGQLESTATPTSSQQEEMDEESLARHRNRLRALMHYLRDLDDLTAARTGAASFVGPSKSTLAHLRETGGHSRTPSMHRAESSNPSTKSRDSGGEYVASTAASSISEGASSEPSRLSTARCSKDDSVRRFRIIAEIVSTERTYVKGLSELVDIYVKPAMAPADGNSGVPVIPPSEHRAVFGNVEALLQFHRTVFLPSLVSMASPVLEHNQDMPGDMPSEKTAAVAEKVASVFSTHAAFFKMYTSYINNCDSAQNRINAWMAPSAGNGGGLSLRGAPGYSALQAFGALSAQQGGAAAMYANGAPGNMMCTGSFGHDGSLAPSQRKKIKTFMKRCRTHPRHTQLNVESYLLLPVQRIPRYRLLLEDLVKSTDTTRLADSDALATALEHVTQIASKVNESKRQSEQDRRLLAWQYRIRGPVEGPLVQPHRRLLKDGSLQLKRVVRRIPGFVRSGRSASVSGALQQQQQRDSGGALSPTELPGQDHVLSADHLQQVTEDQSMSLILCSDVAVLCIEQSKSKDVNTPVMLRSMLKLIRPVEILGGVNLRVVDRSEILYLAASSPEEAVAWKTAFDLHFYQ